MRKRERLQQYPALLGRVKEPTPSCVAGGINLNGGEKTHYVPKRKKGCLGKEMAKGYTRVGDAAAAAEYHSFVDLIVVQLCSKVKLYRWGGGKDSGIFH